MGAAVSTKPPLAPRLAPFPFEVVWREIGAWHVCVPVCASLGAMEFGDG